MISFAKNISLSFKNEFFTKKKEDIKNTQQQFNSISPILIKYGQELEKAHKNINFFESMNADALYQSHYLTPYSQIELTELNIIKKNDEAHNIDKYKISLQYPTPDQFEHIKNNLIINEIDAKNYLSANDFFQDILFKIIEQKDNNIIPKIELQNNTPILNIICNNPNTKPIQIDWTDTEDMNQNSFLEYMQWDPTPQQQDPEKSTIKINGQKHIINNITTEHKTHILDLDIGKISLNNNSMTQIKNDTIVLKSQGENFIQSRFLEQLNEVRQNLYKVINTLPINITEKKSIMDTVKEYLSIENIVPGQANNTFQQIKEYMQMHIQNNLFALFQQQEEDFAQKLKEFDKKLKDFMKQINEMMKTLDF